MSDGGLSNVRNWPNLAYCLATSGNPKAANRKAQNATYSGESARRLLRKNVQDCIMRDVQRRHCRIAVDKLFGFTITQRVVDGAGEAIE